MLVVHTVGVSSVVHPQLGVELLGHGNERLAMAIGMYHISVN